MDSENQSENLLLIPRVTKSIKGAAFVHNGLDGVIPIVSEKWTLFHN